MKTIFIQSNSKQYFGAKLAEYTFLKYREKNSFNIEILKVEDFPQIYSRQGQKYLRKGEKVDWNKNDLQSFTLTRFLPPQLMNYKGLSIVVDPDIFAISDPNELFNFPLAGCSLACCIDKNTGEKKFKSSVMLLDCEKLTHWNWDQGIEDLFLFKRDYRDWMGLKLENEKTIAELPRFWNDCDHLDEKTKFIHFTLRKTQPWKTGLNVDFQYDPSRNILRRIATKFKRKEKYYLKNPHPNQEKLFFQITKSAINSSFIKKSFIENEIENGHLRRDFFQTLNALV